MMWMGKVSAWAAVAIGVLFGALAVMSWDWQSPVVPALNIVCALLLLIAAFRTLRKMSGGLRLLCGAWGLVAGLSIERFLAMGDAGFWSQLVAAIALASIAGLALTVLHKEK